MASGSPQRGLGGSPGPYSARSTENSQEPPKGMQHSDLQGLGKFVAACEQLGLLQCRDLSGSSLRFSAFLCVSALNSAWPRAKKTSLAPPGAYARHTCCAWETRNEQQEIAASAGPNRASDPADSRSKGHAGR